MPGPLGRRAPSDWKHVERFALAAAPAAAVPDRSNGALGVNWYVEFDKPAQDAQGRWWVARDGKLTRIRGGHCVALPTLLSHDRVSWWPFYDQGHEGACVGFGCSRMLSMMRGRRFHARWLWDAAKATDEWPDTNPGDDEGTSVRAALDVIRTRGHVRWSSAMRFDDVAARAARLPAVDDEIPAYRWATSGDELLSALANPTFRRLGAIVFLNSWGDGYPRRTWMPLEVVDRLIHEDGEAAFVTAA